MNRYINHHILLPAIAIMTCIVAACSSEPDPEPPGAQSSEQMVFEVADGSASRAVATTNENIKDHPFMLFGDVVLGTGLDSIFYWHPVKYLDPKNWDYGTEKQYWYMGREHSFVAIHPYLPDNDPQVSILEYKNSVLSFTYNLPEKLEDAADLLFATHRRKYSLDNTGPVSLRFTHLLARINISMALIEEELMYDHVEEGPSNPNKNEYIAVHSVEFKNVKTKGAFSFYPVPLTDATGNSTYDYKKEFLTKLDESDDVVVTLADPCIVPNSYKEGIEKDAVKYVSALKNEIIVMLPQQFTDDTKIIVNYSINEDVDLMRKIVINLKELKKHDGDGKDEWMEGTVYTYKFLIDNVYLGHIHDGKVTVDIDDLRFQDDDNDDSWFTDDEDEKHNIKYGIGEDGNFGSVSGKKN